MQRPLIVLGSILLAVGLLWPWLSKLGLGRLPGDIRIERDSVRIYIPLVSMLLLSVAVSLIIHLVRRLF